jgi:hypothetical protein
MSLEYRGRAMIVAELVTADGMFEQIDLDVSECAC